MASAQKTINEVTSQADGDRQLDRGRAAKTVTRYLQFFAAKQRRPAAHTKAPARCADAHQSRPNSQSSELHANAYLNDILFEIDVRSEQLAPAEIVVSVFDAPKNLVCERMVDTCANRPTV